MTSTLPATESPIGPAAEPSTEKLNKFEKFKAEKDGLAVGSELESFAQMGWEAMDATDRDHRLKWLGLFFRPVTPGKFMLRLRLPSGIMTSAQISLLGEVIQRYGDDGCADITTRQNLQLRGIRLEDVPEIFRRFESVGLTSIQSGMDNVRNITASPVAGLDADEYYDTRELVQILQDRLTNCGQGNPAFSNLPRKFNIAIAGCRDNSVHVEINDIAFVPAFKSDSSDSSSDRAGQFGFNVLIGGFFSATRVEAAVPMNVWVTPEQVVDCALAILSVFRDHGPRANRQKSRLMWLLDQWGIEKFRSAVEQECGFTLQPAALKDAIDWDKRDHLGVYPQKQAGLNYVGLAVPVGRLTAQDMFELARLADVYGSGELRLTVEQNVIIPNVPDSRIDALLQDSVLEKFPAYPSNLMRGLVSCTGKQFCSFAMVDTKNQALALMTALDAELEVPNPVRVHWTGCPNSCGQPQVADIGLMGTKVRKNGQAAEGVDLFTGGKVGKDAHLGTKTQKGIACDDLKPLLRTMLIEQFGAKLRAGVVIAEAAAPAAEIAPIAVQPAQVVFQKSGKTVSTDSGQSLLAIATAAGLTLESDCKSGTCGTCKQTLLSGQVEYPLNPPVALSPADLAAGAVLACSAHPIGNVVLDL
jgi:ferredoxin-nitrite reductase